MKTQLKIYLVNMKRIYASIFEQRDIGDIIADYYNGRWISKSELTRLFEHEKQELIKITLDAKAQYNDLVAGFSLNCMQNYELLERKFQGQTKM